jgi:cytoskeletal protein CcmA (bactofilin family)
MFQENNMSTVSRKMRWVGLVVVVMLAAIVVSPARAAEFRGEDTITIAAGETIDDDLFVSGQTVTIAGTVNGDAVVTAEMVTVSGDINGNLVMAGETLRLDGRVTGSVLVGGYALTLGEGAEIDGSLYFGGYHVAGENGSVIGRNAYIGGYQALLDGNVGRDLYIGAVALELSGDVAGDLIGEVSGEGESAAPVIAPGVSRPVAAVDPGLRISDSATVGGEINVTETTAAAVNVETQQPRFFGLEQRLGQRVGEWLALLIVGGLLLYLTPNWLGRAEARLRAEPLPSLGWGTVIAVVFPFALFVAVAALIVLTVLGGLVTFGQLVGPILGVGGALLGLGFSGFLFLFYMVTKIIVALVIGRYLVNLITTSSTSTWTTNFAALAVGALIYQIIRALPVAGFFVALVVILIGIGAIYLTWRGRNSAAPVQKEPEIVIAA